MHACWLYQLKRDHALKRDHDHDTCTMHVHGAREPSVFIRQQKKFESLLHSFSEAEYSLGPCGILHTLLLQREVMLGFKSQVT